MFADASTFLSYNANMRQLVVDKLAGAEMLVLNRMAPGHGRHAVSTRSPGP